MDEKIEEYSITPAGRHILTIGEDLIQNHHAAIVELVKNAYDADSPDVTISFTVPDDEESIVIVVADHGHGMSRQTIVGSWLVPSTAFKLNKRVSPNGRVMQGRKGIGRYAASILGSELSLKTVDKEGSKTELTLKWKDFEVARYLHDVKIPIKTHHTTEKPGTTLTIYGEKSYLNIWTPKELEKLEHELKKMISPVEQIAAKSSGGSYFKILLEIDGFLLNSNKNVKKEISPIPLFDLFDYRIFGRIDASGVASLEYSTQKAKNTVKENINFDLGCATECGNLFFDVRVYDREKDAIDQLIKRGLRNEHGEYFAKNEARNLLNEFNGIGVYRNGFRIRPLGDPDFDWLKLNEQRVQNPSVRIGSNQVIGYVEIESEESSHLQEKSARDGLKENQAYKRLRELTGLVISKLEERRFIYRSKAGLSRPVVKIERELEKLFEFEEIKSTIRSRLRKSGVNNNVAEDIVNLLTKKQDESNKIVDSIRNAVAVYQGQATLGKIINVIMHEGRKPLNYFVNQIPNIKFWSKEFKVEKNLETLDEIVEIANGLAENSEIFVKLFSRLDPLASGKRESPQDIQLIPLLNKAFDVFSETLIVNNIKVYVNGDPVKVTGWVSDLYVIMTNLIENSIYWMTVKDTGRKEITVTVSGNEGSLDFIDYQDSGPGIESHLIESQVIFEPEFSTKPSGTGLGLAIAGEAAARNHLEIRVFDSNSGAYFRLQPKGGI